MSAPIEIKFAERMKVYVRRWIAFIAVIATTCIVTWLFITALYFIFR